MNRTWTAGRRADSDLAAELGVADCFERGHLFMSSLHELRIVVRSSPRRQQAVHAVPGITEDLLDTPLAQPVQQHVTHGVGHSSFLLW